jgi:two-component system response regulator MtrA
VLSADNGSNGLMLARNEDPDLSLLDLMSSELDVCRCLRQFSSAPLIMFGSSQSADVVSALNASADDYLPHPFSPRERMARIHAVLRRAATHCTPAAIS